MTTGPVDLPFGERPEGILVYQPDGTMITTIAPAARPRLSSTDPLHGGPDTERLRAAETFIAYAGMWAVSGDDVVHSVAISLYPNWVGTRQVRHVRLLDDGTRLEPRPIHCCSTDVGRSSGWSGDAVPERPRRASGAW